jgi:hypothetical protein
VQIFLFALRDKRVGIQKIQREWHVRDKGKEKQKNMRQGGREGWIFRRGEMRNGESGRAKVVCS